MFTLTIETSGAAFTIESAGDDNGRPSAGPELARLLRRIAGEVEGLTGGDVEMSGTARDANGHTVARWSLTGDED